MTKSLFSKLDADFAELPVLMAGPTSDQTIDEIRAFAGFDLPDCYRSFVVRYGGAIVGPYSIFGKGASPAMGSSEASVSEVTKRFREQGWPGTEDTLVISMDHAGNPITLNAYGHVYRYDHDSGVTEKLADTFEAFVLWCLKA
jgi:hypothetical protein